MSLLLPFVYHLRISFITNPFNTYVQLSVLLDLKSNPKKFFSFIKNKRNKNIGVSPLCESTSLKFTKQDRARMKNLAPSKTSRTDMISARFLKETADEVAIGLTWIFQVS